MSARRRLLDLFCGEGGSAQGYSEAGFEVIGVDIEPQPRYPYEFVQADATTYPLDGFDAATGSPPCNDHSDLAALAGLHGTGWMLQHTINRFEASGLPYVVENVDSADMPGALVLCGTEFGLGAIDKGRYRHLKRHRRFVSNVPLMGAGGCHCHGKPIGGVYGNGGGGEMARGFKFTLGAARAAMQIPWASRRGVSQAIPPAYTQFIGEQLMAHLDRLAVAVPP